MSKIYKYPILVDTLIEMPVGAKVLGTATQHREPHLWALVDQTEHTELRSFVAIPTGAEFDLEGLDYIGSCYDVEGWMVFHIYEKEIK